MKIAISGSNDVNRLNLIKSFISQWPMYATPNVTIFQETSLADNLSEIPEKTKESLNEIESELFAKILLLENQYKKYKDEGFIIYNGSSVDILVNALILCEQEFVSEEFVEKIIYHHKKMLHDIDVVYFLPDNDITEESPEDIKILESVYWNFYENYQTEFDTSPFFDQKNCPSILLIESDSPINEIKMLLDKNGNLEGTSQGGSDGELISLEKLRKVLHNNPKLLTAALESLKNDNLNKGSIIL